MMPREEEGDGEEEGAGGDGSDDSEVDEPPVGEAWEGTEVSCSVLFFLTALVLVEWVTVS